MIIVYQLLFFSDSFLCFAQIISLLPACSQLAKWQQSENSVLIVCCLLTPLFFFFLLPGEESAMETITPRQEGICTVPLNSHPVGGNLPGGSNSSHITGKKGLSECSEVPEVPNCLHSSSSVLLKLLQSDLFPFPVS